MLTTDQLADQIEKYRRGSLSLLAFEDWFSDQSWNIHQSNRQHDIDAVFVIEDILSRRHSDGLDEETLKQELANAVRPFVGSEISAVVSYWPEQRQYVAAAGMSILAVQNAGGVEFQRVELDENNALVVKRPSRKTASSIVQRARFAVRQAVS